MNRNMKNYLLKFSNRFHIVTDEANCGIIKRKFGTIYPRDPEKRTLFLSCQSLTKRKSRSLAKKLQAISIRFVETFDSVPSNYRFTAYFNEEDLSFVCKIIN